MKLKEKYSITQVDEDSPHRKPKIIVVDDDVKVTASYSRALKGRCQVLSTNDGVTARKLLGACGPVDLLVLDLTMPEYDGIELLRDLAAKGSYLRVALISGWKPDVLTIAGTLATAQGHTLIGVYPKPIPVSQIIDEAGIFPNSP